MASPSWAPDLAQVADYVTSRTLDTNTPGDDTPPGSFSTDTYPTDTQVGRLIEAACRWVSSVTGVVITGLEDTATDVAAMRAAALVELSYPIRDEDVDVATTLLAQAKFARDELVAMNRSQGGDVVNGVAAPLGSFPDARCWRGDEPVRVRW